MCGIGGQFRFDGMQVGQSLLEQMGNAIEHRGRDNFGYCIRQNVGLVHRRLSIIDLSQSGHQPMYSEDGNVVVVYNGEIFNYLELKAEIEQLGFRFRTKSDTEVIILGYLAFGNGIVNKLEGMFAFALVDFRKQEALLARDSMGIKPLYYTARSDSLSFASEIKALVKSGVIQPKINPFGLKDYLHIQLYTHENTLFEGVQSLSPGNYLHLDLKSGKLSRYCYWDVPQGELKIGYEEAIEELRSLIRNAVRNWSRSDVPIAAYISGGLDSSTVATLAKTMLNPDVQSNLYTFSSIFPHAQFTDERLYSDAVAASIQSEHHRVILPKDHMIDSHQDLMYVLDMPIAGYSAPYRTLSKIVREHAKVVLTGHGGDELFCGYPRYIGAVLAKEMNEGYAGNQLSDFQMRNLKYVKGFEKQLSSIFSKSLFGNDGDILKALFYRSEHMWENVNPEIYKQTLDYDVSTSIEGYFRERKTSFLKKMLYLDQKLLLPGLLHVEDRTSMVENLESRTPLLDRKIVEFAAMIPEEYLLRDGLKGMIRKAVSPILPSFVTDNPSKSGTMYPAAELFENDLSELVRQDLQILDRSELFTTSAKKLLNMKPELVNKRNLWALWSLGAWMRSFGIN